MSTLTLQPDATAGVDTYISSRFATGNFGTTISMAVGHSSVLHPDTNRMLLNFDISAIPGGQAISAATLTFVWASLPASSFACHIFRVTQSGWTEAGATWNTYDGTNNWATAGGDWDGTSGIAFTLPTSGSPTQDVTALAADAYTTRSGILRLLIKVDDETTGGVATANSSDNATPANRPQLVVTYAPAASTIVQRRRPFTRAGSRAAA